MYASCCHKASIRTGVNGVICISPERIIRWCHGGSAVAVCP
jgi:hypothetical protein